MTFLTGLWGSPALRLELLLGPNTEGDVLLTATALNRHGGKRLVFLRALRAPLGLLPTILFKDARLRIREEEGLLAVATAEIRTRRLHALLGLTTVGTTGRMRPAILVEEGLILAREGEGA